MSDITWESVIVIESGSGVDPGECCLSLCNLSLGSLLLWGIGDAEHWNSETTPYTANDMVLVH
jgi:hypothetical protein